MTLLMLQARRFPRGHVLSLCRHQAHCGALYLSNEKLAPQMVRTTERAKAKYQKLLWMITPFEQTPRALGLCESIEVAWMGYGLLSLPPSVGLHLSNE